MADWDARFWGSAPGVTVDDDWRLEIERQMVDYIEAEVRDHSTPWAHAATHMLGLWNGRPGARAWRRVWSDHRLKGCAVREVQRQALQARLAATRSDPMPDPTATA